MADRLRGVAGPFPGSNVSELLVVTHRFAFFGLVFGAEVAATTFFTLESVTAHQHAQLEEVINTTSFFKRLVHALGITSNAQVLLEFFVQGGQF